MYEMDRTKKCRATAVILTLLFTALTVWGFCAGGCEIIEYGFMNEPLPSIVMVASFFAAVFSLFQCFLIRSVEKDMAEIFKSIDRKNNKI